MRRIKALVDFVRTSPENLLARANAVYAGLNGNPAYTRLPVDLSEFRVEVNAFAAAIAEALDGGKRAFAERKRQGEVVVHMLLQFAALRGGELQRPAADLSVQRIPTRAYREKQNSAII